ncbi:glycine receptor subunit alpha-3-like [Tubulanus polymorphus]|uniref:glycine receptor subunit alpha-3-like n=1 Tax=Tubulanus polymorphus TaxID=672921 RepID=UPI003DA64D47
MDIRFHWKEYEPIQMNKKVELPEFDSHNIRMSFNDCTVEYSTGIFPCISVGFHIQREFEYYLIQMFVPSVLTVMLSWLSFWLDPTATPARISLGLLTVITMTTQTTGIVSQLPKVSYIKAIDMWTAMCIASVFAALVEFAVVNMLVRREQIEFHRSIECRKSVFTIATIERNRTNQHLSVSKDSGIDLTTHPVGRNSHQKLQAPTGSPITCNRRLALKVESVSRIAFPAIFAIFNVFFWLYTLHYI